MNKVVFVNRYFYPDHSATSQLLSDLAFELARHGKNVQVITSAQLYEDPFADLPKRETINGVLVRRARTTSFGRGDLLGRAIDYLTFYISATTLLLRTVQAGDLIVAKTDPPLISVFAMAAAKIRGGKLVNWVQDIFPEVAIALGVKALPPLLVRVLIWLRDKSWRGAVCNVVLGQVMEEHLLSHGVRQEQIQVIPNWSSGSAVWPVKSEDNPLSLEWGLTEKFVVGYSGNFGRAHEFQTIIDAAVLLSGNDAVCFLFIGGGAQMEHVQREVKKRGLGNVIFKPYQPRDKLAESLSVSDLHVISLRPELEGFIVPSKFYGILAVGRPTLYVGDPNGEVPAILKKESCGATVRIGDVEGFAAYVGKLAADKSQCLKLGARAHELFTNRFDKPLAIEKWVKLIELGSS